MNLSDKLSVALYVRVSTQEQALEGYSIQAQTERLSAYCTAKNWNIFHIYTDAGFSGSNTNRPALNQMIADIKAKRVDAVLVYKLDRLSRSQKDTLYLIEDVFLANGIDFVSMNENFDTSTPLGRAMIGILSVFAQLEREQIKERTAMGRAERAKSGLWHGGGFNPIGYTYDGKLHINEIEAIHVREVYKRFLSLEPIYSIVENLNKKYGTSYTHTAIRSMLTTPLYAGIISWQGHEYEGKHPAIIDRETFDEAQELMQDRYRIASSKPAPFKARTLLNGLLFCANCGQRYFAKGNYSGHGAKKKYRAYYTCHSRAKTNKSMILDENCRNPSYPVVDLDAFIIDEINRLATDDNYLNEVYHQYDEDDSDSDNNATVILRRIDEIDLQIKRLIDLYQINTIDVDELDKRLGKLKTEKAALEKNVQPTIKKKRPAKSEIQKLIFHFCDNFDDMPLDEKRKALFSLINKIIVEKEQGNITIIWAFLQV